MTVHLMKPAAGIKEIEELAARQAPRIYEDEDGRRVIDIYTRNRPRREADLLEGGSLYWIIRHKIRCRQGVVALETHKDDEGRAFCLITLDARIIPTLAQDQHPFQGWRYLDPARTPGDRPDHSDAAEDLPEDMADELRALGLL